jgi:hypothetical protein
MTKKNGPRGPTRFALCINPGEYAASLERRKIYEVLPDAEADQHDQLRVIDESGEDYLYPREYFQLVDLSPSLRRLVSGQGKPRRKAVRVRGRPSQTQ